MFNITDVYIICIAYVSDYVIEYNSHNPIEFLLLHNTMYIIIYNARIL